MTGNSESPSAVFARNVRRLREEARWSQAHLGRELALAGHGLRQSRIAAIEQTGSVSIDQAVAFAKAFRVPLEALLYEKPSRGPVMLVQHEPVARVIVAMRALQREIDRLAIADQARVGS
jgi:transcriptional regulator with XRE-family HTH domain